MLKTTTFSQFLMWSSALEKQKRDLNCEYRVANDVPTSMNDWWQAYCFTRDWEEGVLRWYDGGPYEVRFEQEVYAKTMARSSSKYRCNPTESESILMTTSMRNLRSGRDDGQTMAYHQPTYDGRVVQEGTWRSWEVRRNSRDVRWWTYPSSEDEEMMDGMMLARGRCPHNTRCVVYASWSDGWSC